MKKCPQCTRNAPDSAVICPLCHSELPSTVTPPAESTTTKKCPYCAEDIQAAAIVCRHCKHDLRPGAPDSAPAAADTGGGTDPGLLAFGLTVLSILAMFVLTPFIVIPATALWAAWDSDQVKLSSYQTGISYSPVVLFVVICLLWIVGFPWYVVARQNIKRGTLPLKAVAR